MAERYQAKEAVTGRPAGDYFPPGPRGLKMISSGCALLDCVLGGGWPLGRVSNVVGDKSTGKTLLAIEACSNFAKTYPGGKIWYRDTEAAFDADYAEGLGLPVEKVDFGPDGTETIWDTVEDIFEDLGKCLAWSEEKNKPGLYIIDSLDALSSRAEQDRDIDVGTYGGEKPKVLGELFRRKVRGIRQSQMHLMVISQMRDKIGVRFGEKKTRSGGKALDYYASQIVWLSHMKTLVRTYKKIKRPTGILIKAKAKKNKIVLPFRECDFTIRFGYGIDDLVASVDWLAEVGRLKDAGIANADKYLDEMDELDDVAYNAAARELSAVVYQVWKEVEEGFRPVRRKYGD